MKAYAHLCKLFIYLQVGKLASLRLINSHADQMDCHLANDSDLYGELVELEAREPIIKILPHFLQHPKEICEKERFWLEEHRKRVRRHDTTQPCESTKSQKEPVRSIVEKDELCS